MTTTTRPTTTQNKAETRQQQHRQHQHQQRQPALRNDAETYREAVTAKKEIGILYQSKTKDKRIYLHLYRLFSFRLFKSQEQQKTHPLFSFFIVFLSFFPQNDTTKKEKN